MQENEKKIIVPFSLIITWDRLRRDEEGEPRQGDQDDAGQVRLRDVVSDEPRQVQFHDDPWVGEVVVVGGVSVLESDAKGTYLYDVCSGREMGS